MGMKMEIIRTTITIRQVIRMAPVVTVCMYLLLAMKVAATVIVIVVVGVGAEVMMRVGLLTDDSMAFLPPRSSG